MEKEVKKGKYSLEQAQKILGSCFLSEVKTPIMEYLPAARVGYSGFRPAGNYPSGKYTSKAVWMTPSGFYVEADI